jgi:hypothetical protein
MPNPAPAIMVALSKEVTVMRVLRFFLHFKYSLVFSIMF